MKTPVSYQTDFRYKEVAMKFDSLSLTVSLGAVRDQCQRKQDVKQKVQ
jgi:hypothetical protein